MWVGCITDVKKAGWSTRKIIRHLIQRHHSTMLAEMGELWPSSTVGEYSSYYHPARQPRVMVRDAILYDSKTSMVVIRDILTGRQCVDYILLNAALLFLLRHLGFAFQQNNACWHSTIISADYLRAFRTLPWSTRSLALSTIENIWILMSRYLSPFQDIANVTQQLEKIWKKITQ